MKTWLSDAENILGKNLETTGSLETDAYYLFKKLISYAQDKDVSRGQRRQ